MKHSAIMLLSLLIAGFSTNACAVNEGQRSQVLGGEVSQEPMSLIAHVTILESYQVQVTEIKKKISILEERLRRLANRPHMDPKGFHRFTSQMMTNHLEMEMEKFEERIAWHYEQVRQLHSS